MLRRGGANLETIAADSIELSSAAPTVGISPENGAVFECNTTFRSVSEQIAWIWIFSYFGTLTRIGLTSITTYNGMPVTVQSMPESSLDSVDASRALRHLFSRPLTQ